MFRPPAARTTRPAFVCLSARIFSVLIACFFAAISPALAAEQPSAGSSPAASVTASTSASQAADPAPKEKTGSADPAAEPHSEQTVQVLVFADGDRARGRLLAREGDVLVFQSDRFGVLRVPANGAKVIDESMPLAAAAHAAPATVPAPGTVMPPRYGMPRIPASEPLAVLPPTAPATPPGTVPPAAPGAEPPVTGVASWLRWTQPVQLAALLRDIFGSWHGRFSVSSSMVSGSTDTRAASVETKLQRKWKRDEVSLTGRYEFGQTNGVTSTDVVKANGSWRRTLSRKLFATYRPTLEWNRASVSKGRAVDYLLLQQEIGAGVTLYNRPAFKLRLGLAEAMFDNWVFTDDSHTGRRKESVFSELEMTLPWRGTLTNRGSWYYSLGGESAGWENQFELSKKFTDTLSLSLRHEVRQTKTDERIEDYALWRLLIGFDF